MSQARPKVKKSRISYNAGSLVLTLLRPVPGMTVLLADKLADSRTGPVCVPSDMQVVTTSEAVHLASGDSLENTDLYITSTV